MDITFSYSKSGKKIFSVNNINFHSTYSPEKEAERFSNLLNLEYEPKVLILIEPGFSYCYEFFKKKYLNTKIGIIRIIPQIEDSDNWDFSINYTDFSKDYLLNIFSEEEILCTQFATWTPSEKLFSEQIQFIFTEFKEAFKHAQTILVTRQYFEKKWLLNSCNNIKFLKNYSQLGKINKSIVVAASGPSLQIALSSIKKYRDKIFLLCLSSALQALLQEEIIPDLVLSTDGGYWAGQHLKGLQQSNIKLALPIEGYFQKSFFENTVLIPLKYNDGLTKDFFDICNIKADIIERNGTVSGSALYFALNHTDKNIYFCGLDLASNKGHQHRQPNQLEINNYSKDNFLLNTETRNVKSYLNSDSLKIYRDWFSNFKNVAKIFRIISPNKQSSLGQIKDIDENTFSQMLLQEEATENLSFNKFHITETQRIENIQNLLNFIEKNIYSQNWKKQLFPLDFVSLIHSSNNVDKTIIEERITQNTEDLISKIRNIFNDKTL